MGAVGEARRLLWNDCDLKSKTLWNGLACSIKKEVSHTQILHIYSLLSTYVMNEVLWVIPNSPQPYKLHENIWTVMISVPTQLLSSSEIETSETHLRYIYLFTYFIFQSVLWISILVLVQVPTREQDRLRDLIGLSSTLPYRGWFTLSDPCCITNLNLVALLSSVLS